MKLKLRVLVVVTYLRSHFASVNYYAGMPYLPTCVASGRDPDLDRPMPRCGRFLAAQTDVDPVSPRRRRYSLTSSDASTLSRELGEPRTPESALRVTVAGRTQLANEAPLPFESEYCSGTVAAGHAPPAGRAAVQDEKQQRRDTV